MSWQNINMRILNFKDQFKIYKTRYMCLKTENKIIDLLILILKKNLVIKIKQSQIVFGKMILDLP